MQQERPPRFSEEEASRIWRRAAELQAKRRLPAPSNEQRSDEPGEETDSEGSLSSEDVLDVAREAGIEREFVEQALTEASFVSVTEEETGLPPLRSQRTIEAPIATVQAVLQEVAAAEPYKLRLRDIRGAGGSRTCIFDIAGQWGETPALRAGDMGAGRNATTLNAVLLPDPDSPNHTALSLYCPPNPDQPRSIIHHDAGFGGIGALVGGAGTSALAAEVLALSGAVVLAPAALGALAFGGAGVYLVRVLHRWSRTRDAASLEKLADDVAGAVRIRKLTGSLPAVSELGKDPG